MEKISPKEFLIRQPSYPEVMPTDPYYVDLANKILSAIDGSDFARSIHGSLNKRVALACVDYMQDIVADAGIWRSFVDANRQLYGWSVPFHPTPESYVDYELNREDVRFLVWYVVAMLSEEHRSVYPHMRALIEYADICFEVLDSAYEEAPEPEGWHIARGLEFTDAEDHKAIYKLGDWLFLHSYLLTPAYALTLGEIMASVDRKDPDAAKLINERLEQGMMEDTTGPLALHTPEWVYLILERKLMKEQRQPEKANHPYYDKFTAFTGGETIRFFATYDEMNAFFIDALGWAAGEEHLSQAKGADDYVLMVTPDKGMLMARDVARCISAPQNPLYDRKYAALHAFDLISDRGLCPGDLLRRIFDEDWLPDAKFPVADAPEGENRALVHENRDFLARCFLQIYYRGD